MSEQVRGLVRVAGQENITQQYHNTNTFCSSLHNITAAIVFDLVLYQCTAQATKDVIVPLSSIKLYNECVTHHSVLACDGGQWNYDILSRLWNQWRCQSPWCIMSWLSVYAEGSDLLKVHGHAFTDLSCTWVYSIGYQEYCLYILKQGSTLFSRRLAFLS